MWILGFVLWTLLAGYTGSYYQPKITRESGYFYFSYNSDGRKTKKKLF